MRRLVVVLGILWAVTAAMAQDGIFAEPTVLKCRPVETRGLEDAWRQVDRIDLDALTELDTLMATFLPWQLFRRNPCVN